MRNDWIPNQSTIKRIHTVPLLLYVGAVVIFIALALYPLIAKALTVSPEISVAPVATTSVALVPHQFDSVSGPAYAKQLVIQAFPDAPVMVAIARAESHFIETAKNPGSTATGIFQILKGTWFAYNCTGSRTDAADNIACARKIYDDSGTAPWGASEANWAS